MIGPSKAGGWSFLRSEIPCDGAVAQACLPAGQMKPFRKNCMALMTGTGAKGSQVNFSQISCLLGQQVGPRQSVDAHILTVPPSAC